jgi:hypothetical protein
VKAALLAGAAGVVVACGGAATHEAEPMATLVPDNFVQRDIRRDASPFLRCQVPMIRVELGPWAGSEGNIIAIGCARQLTYYVRCRTSHLCTFTVSE